MFKIILFIFILLTSLNAYVSEDKLKVVIVGKVAKYITFKDIDKDNFIITVYKNRCNNLFDEIYKNKKIKNKPVKINYIDNIDELNSTNILYVSKINTLELTEILQKTINKNILTISDTRGFAHKGGVMQLYFISQKLKIKINTQSATKQNLKMESTLLRIADVVKGKKQ